MRAPSASIFAVAGVLLIISLSLSDSTVYAFPNLAVDLELADLEDDQFLDSTFSSSSSAEKDLPRGNVDMSSPLRFSGTFWSPEDDDEGGAFGLHFRHEVEPSAVGDGKVNRVVELLAISPGKEPEVLVRYQKMVGDSSHEITFGDEEDGNLIYNDLELANGVANRDAKKAQLEGEKYKQLLGRKEFAILPLMSKEFGSKHGATARDHPLSMPLHVMAMHAARVHNIQDLDCAMGSKCWQGLKDKSFNPSTKFIRFFNKLSPCMKRQGLCHSFTCGKEQCTNTGTCVARNLTPKECSSGCDGMCGPMSSCSCCWDWICGDCCWHQGCYNMKDFCSKDDAGAYFSCWTAHGIMWGDNINTWKACGGAIVPPKEADAVDRVKGYHYIDEAAKDATQDKDQKKTTTTTTTTTTKVSGAKKSQWDPNATIEVVEMKPVVNAVTPPPGVSCPSGYFWDGGRCVVVVVPDECKAGYARRGDACYRATHGSSNCPAGFDKEGNRCIKLAKVEAKCPDGFHLRGKECVSTVLATQTCPAGYQLKKGICVSVVESEIVCPADSKSYGKICGGGSGARVCPEGFSRPVTGSGVAEGNCKPSVAEPPMRCPEGYTRGKDGCFKLSPPDVSCPAGYAVAGVDCIQVHPLRTDCPKGASRSGNTCTTQTPATVNCPDGFDVSANKCTRKSDVCPGISIKDASGMCVILPTVSCPTGSTLKGDVCESVVTIMDKCPEGYTARGRSCSRSMKPTSVVCPPGATYAEPSCTVNVSPEYICPVGFVFGDNLCIPVVPSTRKACAEGFTADGIFCTRSMAPAVTCPKDSKMDVDNTCTETRSAGDFVCSDSKAKKIGGRCVTVECPPGSTLSAAGDDCVVAACPPGTIKSKKGNCLQKECPVGWLVAQGGECTRPSPVYPTPCPPGFYREADACVKAKCPPGFNRKQDECIPVSVATVATTLLQVDVDEDELEDIELSEGSPCPPAFRYQDRMCVPASINDISGPAVPPSSGGSAALPTAIPPPPMAPAFKPQAVAIPPPAAVAEANAPKATAIPPPAAEANAPKATAIPPPADAVNGDLKAIAPFDSNNGKPTAVPAQLFPSLDQQKQSPPPPQQQQPPAAAPQQQQPPMQQSPPPPPPQQQQQPPKQQSPPPPPPPPPAKPQAAAKPTKFVVPPVPVPVKGEEKAAANIADQIIPHSHNQIKQALPKDALPDGKCQDPEKVLVDDSCVYPPCPTGYHRQLHLCVRIAPIDGQCPAKHHLVDGVCIPEYTADNPEHACPAGMSKMVDGVCRPQVASLPCQAGYGRKCPSCECEPNLPCPAGERRHSLSGNCEKIGGTAKCPAGQQLFLGKCITNSQMDKDKECQKGYDRALSSGLCMPIGSCPHGFVTNINNECIRAQNQGIAPPTSKATAICPPGFFLVSGQCSKTMTKAVTTKVVERCLAGSSMMPNGKCSPLRRQMPVSIAPCPDGWTIIKKNNKDVCVEENNKQGFCPEGFFEYKDSCMSVVTNLCPPHMAVYKGSCVKSKPVATGVKKDETSDLEEQQQQGTQCSANEVAKDDNACVLIETSTELTPHVDYCPSNFIKMDDGCVTKTVVLSHDSKQTEQTVLSRVNLSRKVVKATATTKRNKICPKGFKLGANDLCVSTKEEIKTQPKFNTNTYEKGYAAGYALEKAKLLKEKKQGKGGGADDGEQEQAEEDEEQHEAEEQDLKQEEQHEKDVLAKQDGENERQYAEEEQEKQYAVNEKQDDENERQYAEEEQEKQYAVNEKQDGEDQQQYAEEEEEKQYAEEHPEYEEEDRSHPDDEEGEEEGEEEDHHPEDDDEEEEEEHNFRPRVRYVQPTVVEEDVPLGEGEEMPYLDNYGRNEDLVDQVVRQNQRMRDNTREGAYRSRDEMRSGYSQLSKETGKNTKDAAEENHDESYRSRDTSRDSNRRSQTLEQQQSKRTRDSIRRAAKQQEQGAEQMKKVAREMTKSLENKVAGLDNKEEQDRFSGLERREQDREARMQGKVKSLLERDEERQRFSRVRKEERKEKDKLADKLDREQTAKMMRDDFGSLRSSSRQYFGELSKETQDERVKNSLRRDINNKETVTKDMQRVQNTLSNEEASNQNRRQLDRFTKSVDRDLSNKKQEERQLQSLGKEFRRTARAAAKGERRVGKSVEKDLRRTEQGNELKQDTRSIRKTIRRDAQQDDQSQEMQDIRSQMDQGFQQESGEERDEGSREQQSFEKMANDEQQQQQFQDMQQNMENAAQDEADTARRTGDEVSNTIDRDQQADEQQQQFSQFGGDLRKAERAGKRSGRRALRSMEQSSRRESRNMQSFARRQQRQAGRQARDLRSSMDQYSNDAGQDISNMADSEVQQSSGGEGGGGGSDAPPPDVSEGGAQDQHEGNELSNMANNLKSKLRNSKLGRGLKGGMDKWKGRYNKLAGRFKGMERGLKGRIGSWKKKFGGLKGRFSGYKKKFSGLRGRFNNLKGGLKNRFMGKFGGLKNKFGGLRNKFGGLKNKFGGLKNKFGGLKNRFNGMKNRFNGMKNKFNGVKNRVMGLKNKFDSIKSKVQNNKLFKFASKWKNKLGGMEGKLEGKVGQFGKKMAGKLAGKLAKTKMGKMGIKMAGKLANSKAGKIGKKLLNSKVGKFAQNYVKGKIKDFVKGGVKGMLKKGVMMALKNTPQGRAITLGIKAVKVFRAFRRW